jgi:hypothetical protein
METSPLSLFEAVFKVIEDRLPFGRQIVTILAALMAAVILVFCIGYLVSAFAVVANWAIISFKSKSFMPLPTAFTSGVFLPWWFLAIIVALQWMTIYENVKTLKHMKEVSVKLDRVRDQIPDRP